MAILSITEYQDTVGRGLPVAEQAVEFSDISVVSKPFNALTKSIRVISDTPCALSFGPGRADTRKHRMPAESERDYETAGVRQISVIATGKAGGVDGLDALVAYSAAMQAAAKLTDLGYLETWIANLRAETEAHNAAKKAADEAMQGAASAQAVARDREAAVQAQQAAMQPQLDQISTVREALAKEQAALVASNALLVTKQQELMAREQAVETARADIAGEVERQIATIKDDYGVKLDELSMERRKLEVQAAAIAKREHDAKALQADNMSAVAAMQALATKISSGSKPIDGGN